MESEALRLAAKLLREKYPIDPDTPKDMIELLKKMP